MLGHGHVELLDIDLDIPRLERILGKVQREAVGVVELEGHVARQRVAGLERSGRLVQQAQAARQRLAEADFLKLERLANQRLPPDQFRVGLAHFAHENGQQAVEQRLLLRPGDARGAWRGA